MHPAEFLAQARRSRCRWILTIYGDIEASARRLPNQGSGLMQKRKFAQKRADDVSLPELLDRLELALTGAPARLSVCQALSDLNRHLGSACEKTGARTRRSAPTRRRRKMVVESLSLFS
jgi:hypothetical protein